MYGNLVRILLPRPKTEFCSCSVATNVPEEIQTTCVCRGVCGPSDGTAVDRPPSPPILISDASNEELKIDSTKCTPFNCPLPKDSSSSCSGPCPGPSTLVCRNSNLPACSDLNISQICPRSCIKFKNTRPTHKSVQMQIPELRDKSQECDAEMFNEHEHDHILRFRILQNFARDFVRVLVKIRRRRGYNESRL
ncbi:unnamed protein product [Arctia plantaginis]|uniref:Uncharacterized protein n=1 Tax=Arctia plantaginis TaxID=874455 RepID=A0A8S1AMU3_ARCPL|nr:unnamed protein product [Arctia plantaginis]